jgi:hypothetical protein
MSPAPASTRLLLRWALMLFTITIVIGILNGTDLVTFERNTLLTHLHAGTLGWITLAVIGAMLWVYDPDDADRSGGRLLAAASVAAIFVYIVGFWTGNRVLRPIAGSAALIPIVGGVVWAARRKGTGRDVPRRGLLLALVSLSIGGVLGILLGLQRTGVIEWLSPGVAEAHPQLLFGGYMFLTGAVLAEWLLVGEDGAERHNRSGQVQVWLIFIAGLGLGVGFIIDVPIIILLALPASVIPIGMIPIRMRRRIRATTWRHPSESRFASAGIIWLVAGFVLLGYLSVAYPEGFPTRPARAFTHAIFVGGMTNVLLGVVRLASRRTPSIGLGQWIYWGLNSGLVVFFVGLMADSSPLIRVGTPILGAALLTAIIVHFAGLGAAGSTTEGRPTADRLETRNQGS